MKTHVEKSLKVVVELNEREARWLKGQLQNSLCPPEEESLEDRGFRQELWDALSEVDYEEEKK